MIKFSRLALFTFFLLLLIIILGKGIIEFPPSKYNKLDLSSHPCQIKDAMNQDWQTTAQENIRQREYYFSWQEDTKTYSTPNRKNNLRFHYNGNGFSVAPRTTKIPQGNYDANTPEQDKKYKEITDWNITFDLDSTQISNGEWNVSNNKAEYITKDITVQYINDEQGMRQNFIVKNPLPNQDTSINKLSVNFSIKTELDCKLSGNVLQFFHGTENVMNYKDLKVWDGNHQPLEAQLKKTNDSINEFAIVVNTKNAAYPITIDPLSSAPNTTLLPGQFLAYFGWSVASAGDVNGDGYSDVIVGAIAYDNGQDAEGAAFIYHGSANGLGLSANQLLEANQSNAYFGSSVSSAGDVNGDGYSDVIVGASWYDNGSNNEGAAFVYHGSATGIVSTAVAIIEGNQENAEFGWSVASAGDVNGDGFSDVILGAKYYDNGHNNEGAAFIYHGSTTGLNNTAAIVFEGNQDNAEFGNACASAGDLNSDGYSDIVIGAHLYDNGQTDEGAAFVYYGSATGVLPTSLFLEGDEANSGFGISVSSAGDVQGDGYGDLIVGANLYNNNNSGRAFIYHGSATGIANPIANTFIQNGQVSVQFGWSVASAGDVNGDGYGDVMVGIRYSNVGAFHAGTVEVFHGSVNGITTVTTYLNVGIENALFGSAIAPAGDVNGDGYSDVIVGSFGTPGSVPYSGTTGASYIYHGSANGADVVSDASRESNQADAQMGISVANAGDVNGDGFGDVVVGAVAYDNGQTNEGRAYVYYGTATGFSASVTTLESNVALALFGESVASAGDINADGYDDIVIGAYKYSNGQANEGAAYVYYGSASGINATPTIIESNKVDTEFGISASSAGDVNGDGYSDIIVGAFKYDNGQSDEGAFYVFHGSAAGINTTAATLHESNQIDANFGTKVSNAGDVNGDGFGDIIVSAPAFDNGQFDEGAAFVYYGSASGINLATSSFLEKNQAYAFMGSSIGSAGDVNGDGYGDVIVGAYKYDNGQTDEGIAFIYHGGPTGITTSTMNLEVNQANAQFGWAVSSIGDLNGDGYSDIAVGANLFDNTETDEGLVFVYHGSPSGISTNVANAVLEQNQANASFGGSIASAGDVNGDGYSDIMVGARYYDNGQTDEGAAFLYYSNDGTNLNTYNLNNNFTLYNADLITKNNKSNHTQLQFGAGLKAKSFLGRDKGKLVWEMRLNYNPFSGSPINKSIKYSGQQNTFTDLGLNGIELKNLIDKMPGGSNTRVRARVKYNLTTAITGQVYGPWRYANAASYTPTFNKSGKHWNGNVSEVWSNNLNWNSQTLPTINDDVIIPSTANHMPRVFDTVDIHSLLLSSSSSLNIPNNKLFKVTSYVTTHPITAITQNSAVSGGEISSSNGLNVTARGVCYGTKPYPDITGTKTVDGSGTGTFTSNMTGLTSNTIYFVRAYATNSLGTAYGQEKSFLSGFTCGEILNYEGEQYNTVLIGNQCWMAENLNFGEMISGNTNMTNNQVIQKYCNDNNAANCATYGGLYQWDEMMNYTTLQAAQGICPVGWHIPSDGEWTTMEAALPSPDKASRISTNADLWFTGALKQSQYFSATGFDALPAGYRSTNTSFPSLTFSTFYWTSTNYAGDVEAWRRQLEYTSTDIDRNFNNQNFGFSVRCVKD